MTKAEVSPGSTTEGVPQREEGERAVPTDSKLDRKASENTKMLVSLKNWPGP